jgi:DNA-binding CsgD family transcriptional regulator
MHLIHLLFWFIAYSAGIAGTAAVLFSYHRAPDREGGILSRLQLAVLLFVFSASFISFSYELSLTDLVYPSGLYIIAHMSFFLGVGLMSIYLTQLSRELRAKKRQAKKSDFHTIFVGVIILLQSIGTLSNWLRTHESVTIHMLYGALQVLLFVLLAASSIRVGSALTARRFGSAPGKKVGADILIAAFVLLVFTADILIGTYYKLQSGEELSIFLLLPLYSCAISLGVVRRVMQKRHSSSEDAFRRAGLSPREQEVARLLITGTGYRQIADQLNISLATVQSHVKSIYRKTRTSNKTELNNYVHT